MNARLTRVNRFTVILASAATLALTATACGGSDAQASGSASFSRTADGSNSTSRTTDPTQADRAAVGRSGDTAVTPPSPKTAVRAAAKSACTGAELKPSLVHGTDADPDPEATQTTATLLFANVGKRTCTVQGHPGVDLVTATGDRWSIVWQKTTAQKVTLRPGVATMAELTFLPVSPASSAPDQKPFLPKSVKVTPPDTTTTATLAWPWQRIAVLRQDGATHPGTYVGPVAGTASN
ncbi:DUF4232 domain-containing protein [Streptomyces sp. NPDC098085]|uniref:DUF4232 domain-containing protein n=1 Tax=Streptomyces sp. NPDC098085 TaxID=3366094 RepID=UPI00380690D4